MRQYIKKNTQKTVKKFIFISTEYSIHTNNLHFSEFTKNPKWNLAFHLDLHSGGKSISDRMLIA